MTREELSARSDRIVELALSGMRRQAIAAEVGCTVATVYNTVVYHRRRGVDIPKATSLDRRGRLPIDPSRIDGLRQHAAKRDMTLAELAERLLVTVVSEDLVDAILDDGDAHG